MAVGVGSWFNLRVSCFKCFAYSGIGVNDVYRNINPASHDDVLMLYCWIGLITFSPNSSNLCGRLSSRLLVTSTEALVAIIT